jgi:predicted aspartyl protease
VVTEPRARALGLAVGERTHTLTGSSGLTTTFRTAVASKVVIGEMTFKNVSFAVVTGGPYADIDAGVIGLPIVMALRTVTWSRDGTVDVGGPSAPSSPSERNLAFDGGRLLLKASVHGKVVSMTLDTGASDSDLNANFADMFPQIAAAGKKGTREIAGAGGPRTFESIEIPEVVFDIAGHHVGVRPAHVAMQRIATIGGQCCIGNAGHDLLVQQQTFRLDFGAMRLTLR